jgi:hypothetical protein
LGVFTNEGASGCVGAAWSVAASAGAAVTGCGAAPEDPPEQAQATMNHEDRKARRIGTDL